MKARRAVGHGASLRAANPILGTTMTVCRASPAPIRARSASPRPPPRVRLVHAFDRPYENVVATARTCYSSKGIVTEDQASARPDRRDAIAKSIYEAGHHTTFQHAHFQFSLENVSRQFLWTFLHSHPFYNSEQVSQRYVEVSRGNYAVPPLAPGRARALREDGAPPAGGLRAPDRAAHAARGASAISALFPGRTRGDGRTRFAGAVQKRAQEIARYVLPVATFAYLYHTVSGITLFRYWRLCESMRRAGRAARGRRPDGRGGAAPRSALRVRPAGSDSARGDARVRRLPGAAARARRAARAFREEFDRELGGRVSRLVDWKANNEEVLASRRARDPRRCRAPRSPTTTRSAWSSTRRRTARSARR